MHCMSEVLKTLPSCTLPGQRTSQSINIEFWSTDCLQYKGMILFSIIIIISIFFRFFDRNMASMTFGNPYLEKRTAIISFSASFGQVIKWGHKFCNITDITMLIEVKTDHFETLKRSPTSL
jgi:hypothetical protein